MGLVDILGWITAIASVIIVVCIAIYLIAGIVYVAYMAIDNWRWKHGRK